LLPCWFGGRGEKPPPGRSVGNGPATAAGDKISWRERKLTSWVSGDRTHPKGPIEPRYRSVGTQDRLVLGRYIKAKLEKEGYTVEANHKKF